MNIFSFHSQPNQKDGPIQRSESKKYPTFNETWNHPRAADGLRQFVLKAVRSNQLDANYLWYAVPFRMAKAR